MINVDFFREGIENLIYIHEEVFWLKECFTVGMSLLVFLFVWKIVVLEYGRDVLLYISAVIGAACIAMGDMEYWSSNDILKLVAPISLFLLAHKKKQESDVMLFIFLVPYFFTSYAFHIYKNIYYGGVSVLTIPFIIFCIALAKQSRALSLFISIVIGILINLLGANCEPGVNDIIINPALITLAIRSIEFRTKNPRYTDFLKIFWITLVCFAFFGSWAFHFLEPVLPPLLDLLKAYIADPLFSVSKHMIARDEEVFWFKECFTVGVSTLVFLFVWRIVALEYGRGVMLYVSAFIGAACIAMGDMEYWSSNDVLKLVAPISIFLLAQKKKREGDAMLFFFLVPYFLTSYVFHIYKNFYYGGVSLLTIPCIVFCITLAKQNRTLSILISIAIGVLINLLGVNCEPGVNDILINPALITLAVRWIEFRTKNPRYTGFLKTFWITLACFAFFGSWAFHYLEPVLPSIIDQLKGFVTAHFVDAGKDLLERNEEVFWLKECVTVAGSALVFLFVRRGVVQGYGRELLLFMSALIGAACIMMGDTEYWSSNDMLKLVAPISMLLLMHKRKRESDVMLFIFLIPYFLTSYAFHLYKNFYFGGVSLLSVPFIIFCIVLSKQSKALCITISIILGVLINLIGISLEPGINDIIINPALITLIVRVIEFRTKNPRYNGFLKIFWVTLICFAFLGSWTFHYLEPILPSIIEQLKFYVSAPFFETGTHLIEIHEEEVFWIKECFTTGVSLLVFLFVWRIVILGFGGEILLFVSAFIGAACIMMGDMEYWSSNDILKLSAPIILFLLAHRRKQESDVLLFIFLVPYFLTSYAFHVYKGVHYGGLSLLSHPLLIFCIILVKDSRVLTVFFSIVVGVLINLIGMNTEPGINDIIINPALLTLIARAFELKKKNPSYTGFLKILWITLICFAFFGSWVFHFVEPILPYMLDYLKAYVVLPFFDAVKHLMEMCDEVFWLKESVTTLISFIILLVVWGLVRLGFGAGALLVVGTFIGFGCIFLDGVDFWSSNDILKLLAPTAVFLLANKKKQDSDVFLYIFLVPYLLTSYEFYRSVPHGAMSVMSHAMILISIAFVKKNMPLSFMTSATVGVLINLLGINASPGTNDIFVNPALITLAVRGLESKTKNPRYTEFLKSFWLTLVFFAYFGSWVYYHLQIAYSMM